MIFIFNYLCQKKLIASALPATARVGRYVVVLVVVAAAVHVVIVVARGWRGGRPLGHARGDLGCHGGVAYGTPEPRGWYAYGAQVRVRCTSRPPAPRGKLPCASGRYRTQEAGARRPYLRCGGFGACV